MLPPRYNGERSCLFHSQNKFFFLDTFFRSSIIVNRQPDGQFLFDSSCPNHARPGGRNLSEKLLRQGPRYSHRVGVGNRVFCNSSNSGWGWSLMNQELMRGVIDALPFATLVVNSAGKVEWWNNASEQIFGWKRSEVVGRPNPIVPRDRQDEFRAFQEIVLGGRTLRTESVRQRKDGALVEVKSTLVPLRDRSGTIAHILILYERVSEPVFLTKGAQLSAWDVHHAGAERFSEPSAVTLRRFTPRQREIIVLVARGCSNREIAKKLSVGAQQVKNYLRGIYREIRVANRADLVVWLNEQHQREGLRLSDHNTLGARRPDR